MSSYTEKLKDRRWQQKRLQILARDNFICRLCNDVDDKSTLDVHHGFYRRGCDPWEYPDSTLWTLCRPCHELVQDAIETIHGGLAEMTPQLVMVLAQQVESHADSRQAIVGVLEAGIEMAQRRRIRKHKETIPDTMPEGLSEAEQLAWLQQQLDTKRHTTASEV